jgi:hypothetical protein
MNIFRRMLAAALVPSFNADQEELKRLRGSAPAQRDCWFRMVQGGNTTGFEHVCKCAQSMKIVAPLDFFKTYRCVCGETFALLPARRCTAAEIGEHLMRLPARQLGGAAQRQPVPKVGAWDNEGDCVEWTGAPQ